MHEGAPIVAAAPRTSGTRAARKETVATVACRCNDRPAPGRRRAIYTHREKETMSIASEFNEFAMKGNVVELADGVINRAA
jgi:hypothetical protein